MTNTAAPAVGSTVAFKSTGVVAGRVVKVEDVRGDGSLVRLTLDFDQAGSPFTTFAHHVVAVAQ